MNSATITEDVPHPGPLERLGELYRFREVIKNFVSQELKVKYRRSALGFLWSLLNPLLQLIVLSLVFSLMFRMPNLSLYILSGIIPWTFFFGTVAACSTSIISAEAMLRRQYFPKLVFPLSVTLQQFVTFALSLVVLLLLLGWMIGFHVHAGLLILPLSFACIFATSLGLGAMAAVSTVYFRDMQHLIGVFLGAWFYLTPIIYPLDPSPPRHLAEPPQAAATSATQRDATEHADGVAAAELEGAREARGAGLIPHRYRFYFKLNPLYSIMAMFQRPIYYAMLPTASEIASAVGVSIVSLGAGLALFWRHEDRLVFAL